MLVIVPSRGRPDNVRRLITAFKSVCRGATWLRIAVDDDDPKLDEYRELCAEYDEEYWVRFHFGPRLRMNGTLNECVKQYGLTHEVIGFMGDDHLPETDGWDETITQIIKNKEAHVVYGNDTIQGSALPTAVFMSGKIPKTLGYMAPPRLIHLYMDNFWLELGKRVGVKYLPDVVIRHVHPITQRVEWDDTYRQANSSENWQNDSQAFNEYMANDFENDLAKLREVLYA